MYSGKRNVASISFQLSENTQSDNNLKRLIPSGDHNVLSNVFSGVLFGLDHTGVQETYIFSFKETQTQRVNHGGAHSSQ